MPEACQVLSICNGWNIIDIFAGQGKNDLIAKESETEKSKKKVRKNAYFNLPTISGKERPNIWEWM